MLLRVEHQLWLDYDGFIRESFVELRLQPRTLAHQTLTSFRLAVGPPTTVQRYRDWNDNIVHHLTISKFHERIEVRSQSVVDTHPDRPPRVDHRRRARGRAPATIASTTGCTWTARSRRPHGCASSRAPRDRSAAASASGSSPTAPSSTGASRTARTSRDSTRDPTTFSRPAGVSVRTSPT
jgi:hypothetical protein